MKDITIVKSAGFCFGVKRAVSGVYSLLENESRIRVLGELIHNRQVNEDLYKKGVVKIDTPDEVNIGDTVVIRAHGVARAVEEKIKENGGKVVDFTCPFVKKIHEIVKEESKNKLIVIVGDKNHPEVIGIAGWCENDFKIINSVSEAEDLSEDGICVVSQTTGSRENFTKICDILNKKCSDIKIYDTICNATKERQREASEISKECDVMFVVGGKTSSNTVKLYDICKENCKQTFHIENFEEIPQDINYKNKKIGITAGASTPSGIIEEVAKAMEEIKNVGELSFEEAMEQTLKTLNTGDVVEGTVVDVRPTEVIVDLGFKSDGIIAANELTDDPDVNPADVVKVGDVISVFVVGVNDGEGKTVLSKKKLDSIAGWKKIEDAVESKEIMTGKVISVVNGGIIVLVEGTRVFVPARKVSDRYTEDLSVFLNQTVELRITEINTRRRRVLGSIRDVLVEQKKALAEKFWADCEAGKKYTGVVKSIMPFGVFVDIGGVEGLLHISELSWKRIKTPTEVVKEGDTIEVYIKEINEETKKISLGFKKAEDNPWVIAQNKFNLDDVVKCKVVRFMPFGVFVELIPGVDGLIHISQIANKRIKEPQDELTLGQEVEAKITELDWGKKRVSLSIRALLAPEAPAEEEAAEAPVEETPAEE